MAYVSGSSSVLQFGDWSDFSVGWRVIDRQSAATYVLRIEDRGFGVGHPQRIMYESKPFTVPTVIEGEGPLAGLLHPEADARKVALVRRVKDAVAAAATAVPPRGSRAALEVLAVVLQDEEREEAGRENA